MNEILLDAVYTPRAKTVTAENIHLSNNGSRNAVNALYHRCLCAEVMPMVSNGPPALTYRYLRYVFERIADHPINRFQELLPWNVRLPSQTEPAVKETA